MFANESAPVSTAPGFEVTIGGQKFDQANGGGVQMLVVEDHVDMVAMLTLRMGGNETQPRWTWKIGDDVTVKIGEGSREFFKGQITSMEPSYQVEGTSSITIRALDDTHKLGRGRQTRTFEEKSDSDIVKEVAGEMGLSVQAEDTGEPTKYTIQRNESNIAFLKRLAARNNFILRVEDGKLFFGEAQFSGSVYTIKMGDNLKSMRRSYNTTDMVQKVVVRGWDIMAKEPIVGQATTGDIQAIGGGQLGADKAGTFGDSTAYITDVPVTSQAQADKLAKSEMNRLARQYCRGSASIQGNEQVRAGKVVNFDGLQQGVNGEVFVLSSRHIISERSGYTTEFSFCATSEGS
ncbi:MAG: phage late control D family protein [Alphaproteobacteria bacterium]|nr:phage late control D family protein [Alphaproteobacteria bacterium]